MVIQVAWDDEEEGDGGRREGKEEAEKGEKKGKRKRMRIFSKAGR